jgi:hypothetical protein
VVLQLENCIEIVNTLWREFDCVFLLDHSCSYDHQRPDGLTATGPNKGLGGAQPKMRNTRIGQDDMESDVHAAELALTAGMVQSVQFLLIDPGPCWMTRNTIRRHHKRSSFRKNNKECMETCKTEERFTSKGGVRSRQQKKELQQLRALNGMLVSIEMPGNASKTKKHQCNIMA